MDALRSEWRQEHGSAEHKVQEEYVQLWGKVLKRASGKLSQLMHQLWLSRTLLTNLEGGRATLLVPNAFFRNGIKSPAMSNCCDVRFPTFWAPRSRSPTVWRKSRFSSQPYSLTYCTAYGRDVTYPRLWSLTARYGDHREILAAAGIEPSRPAGGRGGLRRPGSPGRHAANLVDAIRWIAWLDGRWSAPAVGLLTSPTPPLFAQALVTDRHCHATAWRAWVPSAMLRRPFGDDNLRLTPH